LRTSRQRGALHEAPPTVAALTGAERRRVEWWTLEGMERGGARAPMHSRLMAELDRGARAQERSRELVAMHARLDAEVRAQVAALRDLRAQLRPPPERG